MSFNPDRLGLDPIQEVRLLTGDLDQISPILEDSVYEFLLIQNSNNVLYTALDALEAIISYLLTQPLQGMVGDVMNTYGNVRDYEKRLDSLRRKISMGDNKVRKVPVVITTDRDNWNDFDFLK